MTKPQTPPATRKPLALTLAAPDERHLRRRIARWAHRFFGLTDGEVEDCYQAAWLRAVEHAHSGRPIRNLEHFLRWEVGNSWKMELRRRGRRPTVELDAYPAGTLRIAAAPDPADQVERLADLLDLVGGMELKLRQVLLLRDACGFAPTEICEVLGISRHAYREAHAEARKEITARSCD